MNQNFLELYSELEIETQNLLLKVLDINFLDTICDYYQKNLDHFRPAIPNISNDYFDKQHRIELLLDEVENMSLDKEIRFYIFSKSGSDLSEIIGDISITGIIYQGFDYGIIGFKTSEKYIRKGIMNEAMRAIIRFAFENLNLFRLIAFTKKENIASQNLLSKLNFKFDCDLPQYFVENGKRKDYKQFTLLNL